MDYITSERGMKILPPVVYAPDSTVTIYESSNADEPRIWLGIGIHGHGASTAHLNFDQCRELIEKLQWLMANHYQVEENPNATRP